MRPLRNLQARRDSRLRCPEIIGIYYPVRCGAIHDPSHHTRIAPRNLARLLAFVAQPNLALRRLLQLDCHVAEWSVSQVLRQVREPTLRKTHLPVFKLHLEWCLADDLVADVGITQAHENV